MQDFLDSKTYDNTKPKAYLNWILFDEQFKYVSASSGFDAVGDDNTLTSHTKTNLTVGKNGYLYIYVSNETPNIDVFFDNLTVTHIRGPILEETHYYPFGLTMQGISSKALAFGEPENKDEKFQGQPLDDDLGLNWYGFKWRNHDPQIGRFVQLDPLSDKYVYNSTYAFSENKVTSDIELEGLEAVRLTKPSTWLTPESVAATNNFLFDVITLRILPIETGGGGKRNSLGAEVRTTVKADVNAAVKTDVSATIKTEVSTLEKNAAQGAAFEQKVGADLVKGGDTKIAPQVTILADNGVKTRVDFISENSSGQVALTEAKSSATAPLTGNQKKAFPSIAQKGGVIVGEGKPGYPGGTVIPPTPVNIVRPQAIDKTYLKPPIEPLPTRLK